MGPSIRASVSQGLFISAAMLCFAANGFALLGLGCVFGEEARRGRRDISRGGACHIAEQRALHHIHICIYTHGTHAHAHIYRALLRASTKRPIKASPKVKL